MNCQPELKLRKKKTKKAAAGTILTEEEYFLLGVHWHSVVSFNYPLCESTIIYELLPTLKELWALLANVMAYAEAQLCGTGVRVLMHWSTLLACFLSELISCQRVQSSLFKDKTLTGVLTLCGIQQASHAPALFR